MSLRIGIDIGSTTVKGDLVGSTMERNEVLPWMRGPQGSAAPTGTTEKRRKCVRFGVVLSER